MRISDWSSDVCSSDLSASGWRELKAIEHRRLLVVALVTAQPPLRKARVPPKFRIFRAQKIGRASCRERVCPYVSISVVAVSLQKRKTQAKYNDIAQTHSNKHIA